MKTSNFILDKSKWTKVKFGEVVLEVRATSKNPVKEGLERLVGLEHLDTENIHIKRWGLIKDGTTFSKKFNKGQVLFGRRRAYLKKAAVADFDGICSGDITVFEAKDGLIPGLLPFIVQNEKFFEFAMKNSAGSLSPRVKFKDLANFEFLLPPKNQQAKIAELLWAADNDIEKTNCLYNSFLGYRKSFINEMFNINGKYLKISDLPVDTINGLWTSKEEDIVHINIIRSTEFSEFGEIDLSKLSLFPVSKKQLEGKQLLPGDIVLERSGGGPDQPVGRVCYFDLTNGVFSFSNFTSVLRVNDSRIILPKYLFYFLLHFYEKQKTARMQKQTTGIRNLDYDMYTKIKAPAIPTKNQKDIISKIDAIEKTRKSILHKILAGKTVLNNLNNKIF